MTRRLFMVLALALIVASSVISPTWGWPTPTHRMAPGRLNGHRTTA